MNTSGMNVFYNANVHSVINFAIFYDNYMYLGSVSFEPDFMLDSLPAHITMVTLLPLLLGLVKSNRTDCKIVKFCI